MLRSGQRLNEMPTTYNEPSRRLLIEQYFRMKSMWKRGFAVEMYNRLLLVR